MAHNLFGEKFYSHREPAWHGLGKVFETPLTAVEAFHEVGVFDMRLEDLYTHDGLVAPVKAIVRDCEGMDPKVLGVGGPNYELLSPSDFCTIFDEATGAKVETLGALNDGDTLFATTKLPSYGVKGDEINNYLVAVAYWNGLWADRLMQTPVRVVCQNTLSMAISAAKAQMRIMHDKDLREKTRKWLETEFRRAEANAQIIKGAFEVLASTPVRDEVAITALSDIYTEPKSPRDDAPEYVMQQRRKNWEARCEALAGRREMALQLYQGAGAGMDTVAAKGTAWGLYNAVVELEDHRGPRADNSHKESALFGQRAGFKELAFTVASGIALLDN